jgi:hypothetical protein
LVALQGVKEDPKTKKWTHKLKKLNDITSRYVARQALIRACVPMAHGAPP